MRRENQYFQIYMPTQIERKKKEELNLLKRFIAVHGGGLQNMHIAESECPDFILEENDRRISIEVTAIVNPKVKQKESLQEKIVRKAKEKFNQHYLDELYVLVSFCHTPIVCKSNEIETYANRLYDLVEHVYIKQGIKNKSSNHFYKEYFDDSFIDSIDITNDRFDHWQSFGAYLVYDAEAGWVKERILEKEKIMTKYASHFSENWLLLIANLGDESSTQGFPFTDSLCPQTTFDRIFIYKYMDNRILIVK